MINLIKSARGGDTFSRNTDGTVQSIDRTKLNDNNDIAIELVMTVEDNPVRYCVGDSVPAQGGPGHLLKDGDVLKLRNYHDIKNLSWINDTANQATLQITIGYNLTR